MAVASGLDGCYFWCQVVIVWCVSTAVPLLRFLSEVLEFKRHSFKGIRYVVDTLFNVGNI